MKINNFWGDLTDLSARKEALAIISASVVANTSVTSTRKLFISIFLNNIYRIKVSQKNWFTLGNKITVHHQSIFTNETLNLVRILWYYKHLFVWSNYIPFRTIYQCIGKNESQVIVSGSFPAEISLRSAREICIFIIYKNNFRTKVSKKRFYLILKIEALVIVCGYCFKTTKHCL